MAWAIRELTSTKEPHDPWGTFKCGKHDGDPAVFTNVRDSLYPYKLDQPTVASSLRALYTIPLPERSSYQTCFELTTWKQSAVPFGETLI